MMLLRLCFCLAVIVAFSGNAAGQERERKIALADSILHARGEVYFSFPETKLKQIEKYISVENTGNYTVQAYANRRGFDAFLSTGADFNLMPANFSGRVKNALSSVFYPSYPGFLEIMNSYSARFSSVCTLYQAGTSAEGRKLLMLKISSASQEPKPSVLLAGGIHGNELTGYKLLLRLAGFLLGKYGTDSEITRMIDETEIWIYPLANPDGTFFGTDNTVNAPKRFNANNIDLNRNFPDPAEGDHPDGSDWQPETIALMDFFKSKNIVNSVMLHTGEEVVNYPWDTWSRKHADDNWYREISRSYVDHVHQRNAAYMDGFQNGIVHGYFWYRISGGLQDYVNYFANSRNVTIELSYEGMPDSVAMENYWNYNMPALLDFIRNSHYGITGRITDSETGKPLMARVEMKNHDRDNSWVFSNQTGEYFRLLSPGSYSARATATGYLPGFAEFSFSAGQKKELNFELSPFADPVSVYPVPFQQTIHIVLNKELNVTGKVKLTLIDAIGRTVFRMDAGNVQDNEIILSLPHLPDGYYILKIETSAFSKKTAIMKIH